MNNRKHVDVEFLLLKTALVMSTKILRTFLLKYVDQYFFYLKHSNIKYSKIYLLIYIYPIFREDG